MSKILITGVSGFVGRAVHDELSSRGLAELVVAIRGSFSDLGSSSTVVRIPGIDGNTEWQHALDGVDVVIHSAARVHVMNDKSADPLSAFRKVNVEGTLNLARQAAGQRVRRFIFVSSIKVNGESTPPDSPYSADAVPAPLDPYGVSKMEAEMGLRALADETGMEVVIIRPTLVYGPGVKANFLSMMRWIYRGVPLPFGSIHNKRSFVALDNLVDLIVTCVKHPAAANETFLVSDGEDLSTSELLRRMGTALSRPARLLAAPSWLLESAASLIGRSDVSRRLCGSLQVDIKKNRELLGWTPPIGVDQALRKTAKYFLEHQTK